MNLELERQEDTSHETARSRVRTEVVTWGESTTGIVNIVSMILGKGI